MRRRAKILGGMHANCGQSSQVNLLEVEGISHVSLHAKLMKSYW